MDKANESIDRLNRALQVHNKIGKWCTVVGLGAVLITCGFVLYTVLKGG